VQQSVEQAAGVVEEAELGVAAEEKVGEEQVIETFRDDGAGMGSREEAAEAVAGEAGQQGLGEAARLAGGSDCARQGPRKTHTLPSPALLLHQLFSWEAERRAGPAAGVSSPSAGEPTERQGNDGNDGPGMLAHGPK
jgi:hypothetical protein